MGAKTQRTWLSIIATISLLAAVAPGAAAQGEQSSSVVADAEAAADGTCVVSSRWSSTNFAGQRFDGPTCATDSRGAAFDRPDRPSRALKRWAAGKIDPATVLAAISRNPEKIPGEFDERLRWADSDGSLQVMVSLAQRNADVERFIAANAVYLHWYGDDPRFVARVTPPQLVTLLDSPLVRFVEPDYPVTNFMSDSSADVSARTPDATGVYSFDAAAGPMGGIASNVEGLSAQQVTGAGVTVAVTDSGIDKTHRDFGGWDCEAGPYMPCESRIVKSVAVDTLIGSGFDPSDALPTTDFASAHGTHVAGTIAGNGYYTRDGAADSFYGGDGYVIGIAPSASLISVKNGDTRSAAFAGEALQWQLDHAAAFGIKVSSNSWGCTGGCAYEPDSVISQIQRDLYLAGVLTTFAVGNDGGGPDGAAFSGDAQSPYVLAVAAYRDGTDQLASFSSRGSQDAPLVNPSAWSPDTEPSSGYRRPDVAAPGVDINSAYNVTGGTSEPGARVNSNDVVGGPNLGVLPYQSSSGTSMATPHVSGAAAILFGACPGATNLDVMRAIMLGADPAKINDGSAQAFEAGYGALNVRASLERLRALPACGGTRSWESDEGWTPPSPQPTESRPHGGCVVEPGLNDACPSVVTLPNPPEIDALGGVPWAKVLVSPDGETIYAVGDGRVPAAEGQVQHGVVVAVAFDADTGVMRWSRTLGADIAGAPMTRSQSLGGAVMSHDGNRIYVVAEMLRPESLRPPFHAIYVSALDTATGDVLWDRDVSFMAPVSDWADTVSYGLNGPSVIVSRDDGRLYFALHAANFTDSRVTYMGLDTASGDLVWSTQYDPSPLGDGTDVQRDAFPPSMMNTLGLSPDGSRLFAVVRLDGALVEHQSRPILGFAVLAFDTSASASGEPVWLTRHPYAPRDGFDPLGVTVSPDGTRVFVPWEDFDKQGEDATFAMEAYDAATGDVLWTQRDDGRNWAAETGCADPVSPANLYQESAATSPSGDLVYMANRVLTSADGCDWPQGAVLALDAATGEPRWRSVFDGGAGGVTATGCAWGCGGVLVAPGPGGDDAGSRVFVTGTFVPNDPTPNASCGGRPYCIGYPLTLEFDGTTGGDMRQYRWIDAFYSVDDPNRGAMSMVAGATPGVLSADGSRLYQVYGHASIQRGWSGGHRTQILGYALGDGDDPGRSPRPSLTLTPAFGNGPLEVQLDGSGALPPVGGAITRFEFDFGDGSDPVAQGSPVVRHTYDNPGNYIATLKVTDSEGRTEQTMALVTVKPNGSGPDPEPTPTPTESTASPTPTETGSASPSPSESPQPDVADVSFTDNTPGSAQHSDETLFEARLSDSSDEPIEGRELTFELTGSESTRSFTATTNGDGVAAVTPRLEEKPGPHWLTVRFAGDEEHAGDADTRSFVVDKEDSALALTVENGDKTLRARLVDLDDSSAGIPERTIDFYSDGELIGSGETDADGVASFALPPRHRGNNRTYEGVFEGDEFYLASSDDRPGKSKGGKGGGGNGGQDASAGYGGKVLLM